MKDRVFIDTNIVVYAHLKQTSEIDKWAIAFKLITKDKFVLSTQVLSEYYAALLRNKIDDELIQENIRLLMIHHEISPVGWATLFCPPLLSAYGGQTIKLFAHPT